MAQLENFRLKVFRSVAEHLSFRKAAEHLFLTQPAITLQIKALENDVGARLFDRSANRVSLTSQGQVLFRYASKLAELASEAERELGAEREQFTGELPLGVSTTIAQYVLPRLLGAFLDEHPGVRLALHSGNTGQITEWLLRNKSSIGLIEGPARERGIHSEPFMQDELVLVASRNFDPDRLMPQQLLNANLLMREHGSGSRRVIESALAAQAGLKLKKFKSVMNLDSTESIKSVVEAGLGIAFVSRWAISKELELGLLKIVAVEGLKISRYFSIISCSGPEQAGPAGAFRIFALARGGLLSATVCKPQSNFRQRR